MYAKCTVCEIFCTPTSYLCKHGDSFGTFLRNPALSIFSLRAQDSVISLFGNETLFAIGHRKNPGKRPQEKAHVLPHHVRRATSQSRLRGGWPCTSTWRNTARFEKAFPIFVASLPARALAHMIPPIWKTLNYRFQKVVADSLLASSRIAVAPGIL